MLHLLSQSILAMYPGVPKKLVHSYSSSAMSLIDTAFVPYQEYSYDHYHFVVPVSNPPPMLLGGRRTFITNGSFFPCNPGQPHRAEETGQGNIRVCVLDIKTPLIRSAAEYLYNSHEPEFYNRCMNLGSGLKRMLSSFTQEYLAGHSGCELALQTLSVLTAVALLREGRHSLSGTSWHDRNYANIRCVERAKEYIRENMGRNFGLEELAGEMHYSTFHFLRLFKASTGMTPFEYLMEMKIEKAKCLLKIFGSSITEVSLLCGFSSPSYFCQAFKKKTGVTPSYFKKNI